MNEALRDALIELQSFGATVYEAAEVMQIAPNYVSRLVPNRPGRVWFRPETLKEKLVRAHASGIHDQVELARMFNSTPGSVHQLLWRAGITMTPIRRPRRRPSPRPPFDLPPERNAEYKELRKLGLTVEECGWCMGLLARPEAGADMGPVTPAAKPGTDRRGLTDH